MPFGLRSVRAVLLARDGPQRCSDLGGAPFFPIDCLSIFRLLARVSSMSSTPILENILNPSGDIPEGYQMLLVTTRGGQTYAGTLASENEQQLVLRVVGLPPVTLAKSEIQSREKIPTSMMPEGLLAGLKDTEIIDLIVYLRTTKNPADK